MSYLKIALLPLLFLLPIFLQHVELSAIHKTTTKGWSYDLYDVPSYDYGNYGIHKNPLFIAAEIVHHFHNDSKKDIGVAINNANWLVKNSVSSGNYSTLPYDFLIPQYDVKPPWLSAMAQARAADALTKAHQLTDNQTYLDTAQKLMHALYIDANNGGVTYKLGNDSGWWYEEYAEKDGPQPRVLNGMMATLRDLNRYYEYTHDPEAKFLFDKGIMALKENIHLYDINREPYQGYSFYDVLGKPAGENYHKYHVALLSRLLNVTHDDTLEKYFEKWGSYTGPFPKPTLP
jgi:heparosan-N-sulfate-glucuronate 5-epimerase